MDNTSFFSAEELKQIASKVGTISVWDYNTALGDTIREKYESLYVKCIEMLAVVTRKTQAAIKEGSQYWSGPEVLEFWIVTSPEICSIFEITHDLFRERTLDTVGYVGEVGKRFKLYYDNDLPVNQILIGHGKHIESPCCYALVKIANFVI